MLIVRNWPIWAGNFSQMQVEWIFWHYRISWALLRTYAPVVEEVHRIVHFFHLQGQFFHVLVVIRILEFSLGSLLDNWCLSLKCLLELFQSTKFFNFFINNGLKFFCLRISEIFRRQSVTGRHQLFDRPFLCAWGITDSVSLLLRMHGKRNGICQRTANAVVNGAFQKWFIKIIVEILVLLITS